MMLPEAPVSDDSGKLNVVWFNQPFLANQLHEGDEIFLAGEVEHKGGLVMKNPDYEKASGDPKHAARLVPIYPESEKLTSRWLRPKIQSLLRYADELEEFMPGELLARRGFLSCAAAVRQGHFPESAQALERARERLAFEEMFVLHLAAQLAKPARKALPAHPVPFAETNPPGVVQAL